MGMRLIALYFPPWLMLFLTDSERSETSDSERSETSRHRYAGGQLSVAGKRACETPDWVQLNSYKWQIKYYSPKLDGLVKSPSHTYDG